jgi:hypothetical protein
MPCFGGKLFMLHAVGAAIVAVAAGYACCTGLGTGIGTAGIVTDNGIGIVVTDVGAALYPGGSTRITFHVHSNETRARVMVGKVVQDGPITGLPPGCPAAAYSFADVPLDEEIAPQSDGVDHKGILRMANSSSSQDACALGRPVFHLRTAAAGI